MSYGAPNNTPTTDTISPPVSIIYGRHVLTVSTSEIPIDAITESYI